MHASPSVRPTRAHLPALACLALLLPACGEEVAVTWPSADSGEASSSSDSGADSGGGGGTLALTDANGYASGASLTIPVVTTAEAMGIGFEWSGVATSLACDAVDPAADVQTLMLLQFPDLPTGDVEEAILTDAVSQADVGGLGSFATRRTVAAAWTDLGMRGTGADPTADYVEDSGVWMAALVDGDTLGRDVEALLFVEPSASSERTRASFPDACGGLTYAADLESLTPVVADATGPWTVDWSAVTTNGQGRSFIAATVDQVVLARYDGAAPADLEDALPAVDARADATWMWTVSGVTALDLGTLPTHGDALPTLTTDATWLLSLRCSTCFDPAPVYLTVLTPS